MTLTADACTSKVGCSIVGEIEVEQQSIAAQKKERQKERKHVDEIDP